MVRLLFLNGRIFRHDITKMKTAGYRPEYDFEIDLRYGHEAEQNLQGFYRCLGAGTVEVKADRYRNGRMIVETQQQPNRGQWKDSGINVTTATWWAYRLAPDSFILVSVQRLKKYLRANQHRFEKQVFAASSDNPSKGYLLMPEHISDMQTNPEYD